MPQESWPFENGVRGVAVRSDFPNEDCECDPRWDAKQQEGCPAEGDTGPAGCANNDVFIVDASRERYGNKAAWEVCRAQWHDPRPGDESGF